MNNKKSVFGFFFELILIAIPIFNILHFTLIDHHNSIDNRKKEVIHHQCNHYTFHSIFIDTHDDPTIIIAKEYKYRKDINQNLIKDEKSSSVSYRFTRGPPNNL